MQQHFGLVKNFTAEGVIEQRRIVAFGAEEGHAKRAGVGDVPLGVSGIRGAAKAGARIDAYMDGIREVEFGGPVAYGDPLTSDAEGRAIVAAPGAGTSVPIIGRAMDAGDIGVIGHVHVAPSILYG